MSRLQVSASAAPNLGILLTNLRLLDLDTQDDWPNITARSFTAKDAVQTQKTRIQCVEWIFYYLFRIWDFNETSNVWKFPIYGNASLID